MATFTYGGTSYPLVNGIFLCSTTATSGGSQSNGLMLQYRGQRKAKVYADRIVFQALGRTKPATEIGSYNFLGVDFSYAIPPTTTDFDGVTSVTGATLEARIFAINTAIQAGNYVEYYDSRGRHLVGTWTQDPEISDLGVGWREISASLVEVG